MFFALDECTEETRLQVGDLTIDGRQRNSSFGSANSGSRSNSKRRSQTCSAADIAEKFSVTVNAVHRLNAGTNEVILLLIVNVNCKC